MRINDQIHPCLLLSFGIWIALIGCVDTMEWTDTSTRPNGTAALSICVAIHEESLAYRAKVDYGVNTDYITLGKSLERIILYEVSEKFSPQTVLILKDGVPESALEDCPANLPLMRVKVLKIECEAESNPLGFNSVSTIAHLLLELNDRKGNIWSANFPSPKVYDRWLWLTSPSYALGKSAIPEAIQQGLRYNIAYIASCQIGRCKSKSELAIPKELWVQSSGH